MTSQTDENGIVTQYIYNDPLGRLTQVKQAISTAQESWTIGYVRAGENAPGTDSDHPSFSVHEYCFGPATSALSSTIPGCPALGSANNGSIRQIVDTLNGNNSQAFSYDTLNRLAAFTNGNGTMQQTYDIDPWGNMSQLGTSALSVSYGGNNRINSSGFGYDTAGNLNAFNNGVLTNTYVYDAENKLVNVNSGAAAYTYDAEGNRVRKDASGSFTEYVNFGGQTLAEKASDGTWSNYIYANGERLARVDNYDVRIHMSGVNCSNCGSNPNMFAGTTSLTAANGYTIRAGDTLSWRQYQDGSALGGLYLFFTDGTDGLSATDMDGQLIERDATKNSWHVRIVALSPYAGKTIGLIDPFDWTTAPAGSWDIYYGDITLASTDGSFIPIYSRSMMGLALATNPTVSNFSAVTEKAADTTPLTTTTYYHGDQINSTRLISAGTGWPVASYTFYPFGLDPMVSTDQYLFTGKERDAESGLDYFSARYYGSSMGRFMSPDPLGGKLANPQSLNRYAYGLNNPLNNTDPTGMYVCEDSTNCDSKNDQAFAESLTAAQTAANGLKDQYGENSSEYTSAQRAIDSYGAQGVDNGVNVRFDSNVQGGQWR